MSDLVGMATPKCTFHLRPRNDRSVGYWMALDNRHLRRIPVRMQFANQ